MPLKGKAKRRSNRNTEGLTGANVGEGTFSGECTIGKPPWAGALEEAYKRIEALEKRVAQLESSSLPDAVTSQIIQRARSAAGSIEVMPLSKERQASKKGFNA